MSKPEISEIHVMRPQLPEYSALEKYVRQIDSNGIYTNLGPLVSRLEERLGNHFSVAPERVVSMSNGTAALQLSLLAVRKTGRYCIMPSWTFVATAHAAKAAGLEPYFVDVEFSNQQMSLTCVQEAVEVLGADQVGAVCLVAPFGAPIQLEQWERFQEKNSIPVVLDAAAAFATTKPSKITTCVSLHATKILPAGEGGFVLAASDDIAKDIKARSNFGFAGTRDAVLIGGNAKMSEYHAAIGHASLDNWPHKRRAFYELCQQLKHVLDGLDGIEFEPGFGEQWFNSVAVARLSLPYGEECKQHLLDQKIYTRRWWSKGCLEMPAFNTCQHGELTTTKMLAASTLGLPCHSGLGNKEFDSIRAGLMSFLENYDMPPLDLAA